MRRDCFTNEDTKGAVQNVYHLGPCPEAPAHSPQCKAQASFHSSPRLPANTLKLHQTQPETVYIGATTKEFVERNALYKLTDGWNCTKSDTQLDSNLFVIYSTHH